MVASLEMHGIDIEGLISSPWDIVDLLEATNQTVNRHKWVTDLIQRAEADRMRQSYAGME